MYDYFNRVLEAKSEEGKQENSRTLINYNQKFGKNIAYKRSFDDVLDENKEVIGCLILVITWQRTLI